MLVLFCLRTSLLAEATPASQRKWDSRTFGKESGTELANPFRFGNPVLDGEFANQVPDSFPESLQTPLSLVWFAGATSDTCKLNLTLQLGP